MFNSVAEKFMDDFSTNNPHSQFKDDLGVWDVDKIFDALEENDEDPLELVRGITNFINNKQS